MRAEVISIGDEITSGQRLDTNSQWLSQQLAELGIRVLFHSTVADDLEANVEVFRRAMDRADVVVATGGLGPTADDLTRDALAATLGVPLFLDEPSLTAIQTLFARRRRPMPERNRVQAMFPEGTRPIPNPHGSAPGIEGHLPISSGRTVHLYALPGVPAEMQEMWSGTVEPSLRHVSGSAQVIRHRCIKCFGVGESDLEQMLPDLIRRGRSPMVGITVSRATISLRISAQAASDEACRQLIEPTVTVIQESLGDLIFGEGEDELEHVVLRKLRETGQTLAVAEWGTCGLLNHWLGTAASLAPETYRGGLLLSTAQDLRWLGIPATSSQTSSADGAETGELAAACRRLFQVDYGLALGPWPQQTGDEHGEHVGYAIAAPQGTICRCASTTGHPEILEARAAKQVLNLLRLTLSGRLPPSPFHRKSLPTQ
jgi:nicotinamide-nucleotide amidase